ncbi:hypothetical protein [Desulfogranum marinum]|uniref:hypothetical protein n=1 Tax=Desulfogranum marinum TaxID=453220 RepID=UPI0029C98934|nr:hypothetical protein [Desulfogranum marinum]
MGSDDNAVISSDSPPPPVLPSSPGWTTATITDIMESWPLQLRLSIGDTDMMIELAADAMVESEGIPLSPGELSPGDRIEIRIERDQAGSGKCHAVYIKKIR